MRTPLAKVRGLGSAKEGTSQFWHQRLTAVALAILLSGFIILVIAIAGRPYEQVIAVLGNPFVSLLLVLMIGAGVWHMKIGMQEIIEDYLHGGIKLIAVIANNFFSVAVGLATALALLKLSFGG
ncbi:succinate dehydrogenase, hydrophobic membrane anchor protein [Kaistia dalseonensis]|nr:succinate dehydrogenase, hydrophobic membrane anchor protein [Kaistia dalseonensis]MCX5494317.1 succinate dehydrogenase, hydrophobic membrane anchor protein [Kaistia dalseonensis]